MEHITENEILTLKSVMLDQTTDKDVITNSNFTVTSSSSFIEANTTIVDLRHLRSDCIIPVFSKDNEKTISHQEFIECVYEMAHKIFPDADWQVPNVRVSHEVKGRTPEAIHKSAKELLDNEKTVYYERMAFTINSNSIITNVSGNKLKLTVGGVRAYNQQNLYSRKSAEKFQFFIGFQNTVCLNLCINTDGYRSHIRVMSLNDLKERVSDVMIEYDFEKHISRMKQLPQYALNESQFAQLLGRARLYNHMPKDLKIDIPKLEFNDSHFNIIAKDFYDDPNFSKQMSGNIDLWKLYNLFTQANKSSYIDSFLARSQNALDFVETLQRDLANSSQNWFLN